MPREKKPRRFRIPHPYWIAGLMLVCIGLFVRASMPVMPDPAAPPAATAAVPTPTVQAFPSPSMNDVPAAKVTVELPTRPTVTPILISAEATAQAAAVATVTASAAAATASQATPARPTQYVQPSFTAPRATRAPAATEPASLHLAQNQAASGDAGSADAIPTAEPTAQAAALSALADAQTPEAVTFVDTPPEDAADAPLVPTPPPGHDPTYAYLSDTLRVDITRRTMEDAEVVYFAVEIWLSDISQLRSAFSSDRFDAGTEPVQDIAVRSDALVAINGDFATFNNGGIIIRNGELYRSNRSTRQLMVIDQNGDFHAYVTPPENAEEVAAQFIEEGVRHTLVFGPVLVDGGEAVPLPDSFIINTKGAKEPRTAVAQLGPLHYLFLVVDGRQPGYSRGVTLAQLQDLFLEHGAITAFNLDGGGSTTLCYKGNVLNEPANGGQRHVPDILYISD